MYKFALVGCGRIAKRHAELLASKSIKKAKLVAVCDIISQKAINLSKKYGVNYYNNLRDMMISEDIDVVSVLTESGNHCKCVLELSKYKSHIIVEKPMALTVKDCRKMISACEKNNLKLFVIKQNRFNIPVQKIKKDIDNKIFGKIFLATIRVRWSRNKEYYNLDDWRGTWKMDGGVLANQAIHHIDLLEWFAGEIDKVYATSINTVSKKETEDTALAVLKFKKNNCIGIIEATTATRPKDLEGSISILGDKGNVEIGGFAVNKLINYNLTNKNKIDLSKYSDNPPDVYGFGHKKYYDHIVRCLDKKEKPLVDGKSGMRSVVLLQSIYKSIESGKEEKVNEKNSHSKLGI